MEHNIRILIGLTNAKFEIEKKSIPHFCHTAKAEEKFELIFILNVEILSKFADIVKTHQGKLSSLHLIVTLLRQPASKHLKGRLASLRPSVSKWVGG